jgi:hypothetical protein
MKQVKKKIGLKYFDQQLSVKRVTWLCLAGIEIRLEYHFGCIPQVLFAFKFDFQFGFKSITFVGHTVAQCVSWVLFFVIIYIYYLHIIACL